MHQPEQPQSASLPVHSSRVGPAPAAGRCLTRCCEAPSRGAAHGPGAAQARSSYRQRPRRPALRRRSARPRTRAPTGARYTLRPAASAARCGSGAATPAAACTSCARVRGACVVQGVPLRVRGLRPCSGRTASSHGISMHRYVGGTATTYGYIDPSQRWPFSAGAPDGAAPAAAPAPAGEELTGLALLPHGAGLLALTGDCRALLLRPTVRRRRPPPLGQRTQP